MPLACGTAAVSRLARRVKMRSVRPTRAEVAGTKEPTWARKVISATWREEAQTASLPQLAPGAWQAAQAEPRNEVRFGGMPS